MRDYVSFSSIIKDLWTQTPLGAIRIMQRKY